MRGRVHRDRRTDQDLRVPGVLRFTAVQRVQRDRDAIVGDGGRLFGRRVPAPRGNGRRRFTAARRRPFSVFAVALLPPVEHTTDRRRNTLFRCNSTFLRHRSHVTIFIAGDTIDCTVVNVSHVFFKKKKKYLFL